MELSCLTVYVITVDVITVDVITVDVITVDVITVDVMTVDVMTVDVMTVDVIMKIEILSLLRAAEAGHYDPVDRAPRFRRSVVVTLETGDFCDRLRFLIF